MITAFYIKSFLEFSHGLPVELDVNTTLNEKYDVLVNKTILKSTMPKIRYYGVGVGGSGDPKTAKHYGTDGDLYEPIPLIARLATNDIAPADRMNYRMRVERNIGGKDYVLYYLKVIEDVLDKVEIKELTKSMTDPTKATVEPLDLNTATILSPMPRENTDIDLDVSKFYVVESSLSFSFTETEKDELSNAYEIMTGIKDYPVITEVCIYSGEDTLVDGLLESYGVRAAYFYTVPYDIQSFPSESGVFQRYINVSGTRLYQ